MKNNLSLFLLSSAFHSLSNIVRQMILRAPYQRLAGSLLVSVYGWRQGAYALQVADKQLPYAHTPPTTNHTLARGGHTFQSLGAGILRQRANTFFGYFAILLFCLTLSVEVQAQDDMSWCKHQKAAKELYAQKRWAEAAPHFESAFNKKPKKENLSYLAGESYYRANQYAKAIALLEPLREKYKDYPMAQLWLARSLKKSGQFEKAFKEYVYFGNNYKGEDKETVLRQVQNEMKGCELGVQLTDPKRADSATISIEVLEEGLNSSSNDFAPIPFGDGVLYFSSTRSGNKARIYRSQLSGGKWSKAETPKGFPDLGEKHFANGSFSEDGNRFYYSQCESVVTSEGVSAQCGIFVLRRGTNGTWMPAQPLREYINLPNTSNTQPFVARIGDQEVLYFSSNRTGGQGGMDLWFCRRDARSEELDFSLPQNCGRSINTPGDELTPFLDVSEDKLYFSSDGQIGIGGFDVFVAEANGSSFGTPKNMGVPVNSFNDDYYFVLGPDGQSGYLTSKRRGADDDIYAFSPKNQPLQVSGTVFPGIGQAPISGVQVSLFEMIKDDQKRLLETVQSASDGKYNFELIAGKRYRIEAVKEGYFTSTYEVDGDASRPNQSFPIYIELKAPNNTPNPKPNGGGTKPSGGGTNTRPNDNTDSGPKPKPSPVPAGTRNMKPQDGTETLITNAPMKTGTYYKVQLQAVKDIKAPASNLSGAQAISRVDTELIKSKGLTRMLLGDYDTFDAATAAQKKAEAAGFTGAFIVRYENGVRIRKGQ